jgi:hypothetical protein
VAAGQEKGHRPHPNEVSVPRLIALLLLTAAFAPAAVMGALPIVLPVVIVIVGLGAALSYLPVPSRMSASATSVSESAGRSVPQQ